GFAVADPGGQLVAVDTYAYLGAKPSCRSRWTEGTRLGSVAGIWQQRTSGSGVLSVLAVASCEGLDGDEPLRDGPAALSDDVRKLVAGWAPGRLVSVRGIVVARWKSSAGAFGFALQDPDGAPSSGVRLVRSRSSPVPASAPEVGDEVRVTA